MRHSLISSTHVHSKSTLMQHRTRLPAHTLMLAHTLTHRHPPLTVLIAQRIDQLGGTSLDLGVDGGHTAQQQRTALGSKRWSQIVSCWSIISSGSFGDDSGSSGGVRVFGRIHHVRGIILLSILRTHTVTAATGRVLLFGHVG